MTYQLLTTPGGHGYFSGSVSTMPALVDGLKAIALQADTASAQTKAAAVDEALAKSGIYMGQLLAGDDLNDAVGPTGNDNEATYSLYWIGNTDVLNPPPHPWTGALEVWSSPNERQIIQRVTYSDGSGSWWRRLTNTTGGWVYGDWQPATPDQATQNTYRAQIGVDAFTARRGGRIGTDGRKAVALRFDHHLDPFAATVLPLLRQRALPWTQAVNPQKIGTGDDTLGYAALQAACIADGGEVWNHGGNHADATGQGAIYTQIVGSLDLLQTNLPGLPIEGWAPPGLGEGGYDGYTPPNTYDRIGSTYAGRLVMANHAVSSGYLDQGVYRLMDGRIRHGQAHITIDALDAATVAGYLDALPDGMGLVLMLHPSAVGDTISVATLTAILDDIVTRRAAGTLDVLSHGSLVMADASHSYRHNLLTTSSWTDDRSETVFLQRQRVFAGGAREFVATVNAPAAMNVTTGIGSSTRTHAVPAGASTIRHVATIPQTADQIDVTFTGAGVAVTGAVLRAC